MQHTTLVLSIVPSFSSRNLNRNFPPNNPSALSIFNYLLALSYLTDCRHAAVSCQGSKHSGSCVNGVKIFYRINLGHNNVIDERVNFDSPNKMTYLHRQTDKMTYLHRQTHRQTDKITYLHRQTHTQTDKVTDVHRHTDRQADK